MEITELREGTGEYAAHYSGYTKSDRDSSGIPAPVSSGLAVCSSFLFCPISGTGRKTAKQDRRQSKNKLVVSCG